MGFQVPDDLVNTHLSLQQVQQIIANRKQRKALQNRIDALPAKREEMLQTLADLTHVEADMIENDTRCREAAEAVKP